MTIFSKFLVKNLIVFFFAFLIMKNIVVSPAQARFPVKLTCYIAFGSASTDYFLLKSVAIMF